MVKEVGKLSAACGELPQRRLSPLTNRMTSLLFKSNERHGRLVVGWTNAKELQLKRFMRFDSSASIGALVNAFQVPSLIAC